MTTEQLLIALVRYTVCGRALDEEALAELTEERIPKLYTLSKLHDMAHIVSYALHDLGIAVDAETAKKLQKQQMLAVYRAQQLEFALQETERILTEAKIPYLPLKGSIIRNYYPESWMRTSCDIDILVHEEDLERGVAALVATGDYTEGKKDSHDVSLHTSAGVCLELHYSLLEDDRARGARPILKSAWSYASLEEGSSYRYAFTDAMFYFYHIAHMAKHFENGGCGVRPFLDLWLLDHMENCDLAARDALLEKGGLSKFANVARTLSKAWFGDGELDPVAARMEFYVLGAGLYGTHENRVVLMRKKRGGKFKYALSRVFLPYRVLKRVYPILEKWPILFPIFQVVRWFKLCTGGRGKLALKELKYNQSVSEEKVEIARSFMEDVGL